MRVAQLYPNRIVITEKREKPAQINLNSAAVVLRNNKKSRHLVRDFDFETRLNNLKKSKTSINLSPASKKLLRDSYSSLVLLSTPRTIQLSFKKFIYNYRASFVTLKLPSEQIHSDTEIKKCLNLFFNNIRKVYGLENYVWKAELQQNENIHFHIAIDKFVNWHSLLHYWNKAINSLGYVDAYSDKFSQMNWEEYKNLRMSQDLKYNNEVNIGKYRNAYDAGCSSKWRRPNTVSVNNIRTNAQVANYLAKYLSKSSDENSDPVRLEKFGKVWARSRSLSRLKYQNKFDFEEIRGWVRDLCEKHDKAVNECLYDYCTVIYFKIDNLKKSFSNFIRKCIRSNAELYAYPFP